MEYQQSWWLLDTFHEYEVNFLLLSASSNKKGMLVPFIIFNNHIFCASHVPTWRQLSSIIYDIENIKLHHDNARRNNVHTWEKRRGGKERKWNYKREEKNEESSKPWRRQENVWWRHIPLTPRIIYKDSLYARGVTLSWNVVISKIQGCTKKDGEINEKRLRIIERRIQLMWEENGRSRFWLIGSNKNEDGQDILYVNLTGNGQGQFQDAF